MTGNVKKVSASFLLTLAFFSASAGALFYPKTAHAIPTEEVSSAPSLMEWIKTGIKEIKTGAVVAGIATSLINTMTYAADRLAYDAAVFVAAGGNAEDPLFENRSVGEYFADYGASVAGEAIGSLDEQGILGNFSLCQPDASITLAFKFGIKSAFDRPKPSCEFKEVKENWGGFLAQVAATAESPFEKNSMIITKLVDMYNPQSNDFSVGIILYTDVLNKAQSESSMNAQRLLLSGFFKDKTDFLTGRTLTPAEMVQKRLELASNFPDDVRNAIAIQALGDPDILMQVGIHAGSVFTNTLLSKFTEKVYNGFFGGLDKTDIDPFDIDSLASGGSEDARQSFRSFLAMRPLSIQNYSILSEFGACPSQGRGLYNCVADSSLISAVARADGGTPLTIQEAIEEGLLQSNWPLIPSSDTARDQDPYCATYGYCHGNLVKLRKARIISVGWELAAESTSNSESSPVTLGEVVNAFHSCNAQGERDENYPWCHLIDPDWVLKYPDSQCKAQVYGQQLETSVSDERQQECVDMPSCIDEDGEGNCTGGYGYCVREENVWRFRGEECPDYYGSCTSYQNPEGEDVNFLSNTTDARGCTADSAGCLWYATEKSDESGAFNWPDYSTSTLLATAEASDDIYRNRIYFTAEVEDCAADDAGCRELVSRKDGTTLNMISNPSFENDDDADGMPDAWLATGAVTYASDATEMLSGADAVNPGANAFAQSGLILSQGAEYTLSFYAKQNAGSANTDVSLNLRASDASQAVDLRGYALDGDCAIHEYATFDSVFTQYDVQMVTTPGSAYARSQCTFTVPTLANPSAEIFATVTVGGGDLWFDDIQLEQESSASIFHEGYSSAVLDLAYVKMPPSYLGCTGDAGDPEECANYAAVCSETDVGCSLYAPENGDPSVAGIANDSDMCPEACVGYDTFKQEPTRYEPEGDFPVYFIPDSGETCSAQYVGCDEFTNIATEEVSSFTYLRACVTPDQAALNAATSSDAATFYTWEGSDTDGYQLKTWNLLESDMGATPYVYLSGAGDDTAPHRAPCTSWTATDTGIVCNDDSVSGGVLDADTDRCDEHDDIITNPDCREFYDVEGTIHYREWTSTVTVDEACVTYRKTDIVGADTDAQVENCEGSGGYFDLATATCRYYGNAEESFACPVAEVGCREYTGGRSRNSRQAFVEYFEDGDLTNWDAGSASAVTLSNESIAVDGHSIASEGEAVWTFVGGGSECTAEGGCETSVGTLGGICTVSNGESSCGTLHGAVYAGKTYTLSFWAKGTGELSVGFGTAMGSPVVIEAPFAEGADGVVLESGWNEYTYGPLDMNARDYPNFGNGDDTLIFAPVGGASFYIDNVVLREGEDNITIIKDSWVTPAECDATPEGTSSPQYYLGCAEYRDQNSEVAYLKSFSSLCSESQVGCEAFFQTQESNETGASVYGALCSTLDGAPVSSATSCYYGLTADASAFDETSQFLCTIGAGATSCEFNLSWYVPATDLAPHLSYAASTVVSPADKDVFLVVNSDVECSSSVAGCTEVGLPTFTQDHTAVESWTSTYLLNTPEDYASTLCSQDELFCDAWQDNNGDMHYFRDPQNQTCEYRTDVTVDGVTYSGWFHTGTDALCYDDYVIGGDAAGIWRNGDDDYAGWVGTCEARYDSCREFQDLVDLAPDQAYGTADGESYYYLNNETLEENSLPDSQKCNGEVSQKEGCGLFNDTSEPNKTANMSASYVASKHADALFGGRANDLVDPIDCESSTGSVITTPSGETIDLCANRCAYLGSEYYDISGTSEAYVFDGSCYNDSDCRPLTSETGESVEGSCMYFGVLERLENDANTVLKVNRDRECSEWLSCSDAQTTWDERTNSYVTVCGDIGLCTEYSTAGNASFCSAWKTDEPATVLDITKYTERDVSWYGDEYSGFAIPGTIPVDQLTQVNVAPIANVCNTLGNESETIAGFDGAPCESDIDCGVVLEYLDDDRDGELDDEEREYRYCPQETDTDYRLAYVAGACEGEYGESCAIGYCENSGSACASTADCGVNGGSCLVGSCFDVSETVCASSADCGEGESCFGGLCATQSGDVTMDVYQDALILLPFTPCEGGDDFYPSVNFAAGSCIRTSCVLTPTRTTFDTDTSEGKVCRGYPEINSPFPNSVVTQWQDPVTRTAVDPAGSTFSVAEDGDAEPVSYVQNFENVQTCAIGEDCECSYSKVEYESGGITKYYSRDSVIDTRNQGLCVGGEKAGSFCTTSTNCLGEEDENDDGTCEFPTKIDEALGLEGYCLERDSSTNILGDRDTRACLTWLPVDQLAGSTDNYAKYTEAGYFEETNFCTYVSLFADVKSSSATAPESDDGTWNWNDGTEILCAESEGDYEEDRYCTDSGSVQCAAGYFAVIGPRWKDRLYDDGDKNTFTFTCMKDGGDQDCPYVCVPYNSYHMDAEYDDEGEVCDQGPASTHPGSPVTMEARDTLLPAYTISDIHEFTEYALKTQDCLARGRRHDDGNGGTVPLVFRANDQGADFFDASIGASYGAQGTDQADLYAGCYKVLSTMTEPGDNDAAPWTDRILNSYAAGSGPYALNVSTTYPEALNFAYTPTTATEPFGRALSPIALNQSDDPHPPVLPSCVTSTSSGSFDEYLFFSPDVELGCPEGSGEEDTADWSQPDGRAYSDYRLSASKLTESESYTTGLTAYEGAEAFTVAGDCGVGGSTDTGVCVYEMLNDIFAHGRGEMAFDDGIFDVDEGEFREVSSWGVGQFVDIGSEYTGQFYDVRNTGNPPTVWGLDGDNCYGETCEEDEAHPLTLNDQNEGNVTGNSFYRAYLKFYAAADKNQLPLRRVIVDWGDGTDPTGSTADDNYYKNHRGLWEGTEMQVCETDETASDYEWGMNADSCESNAFSYNHIYTCNPAGLPTCSTNDEGNLTNAPCTYDGESCTYQPRVHARDNWGWCTGTCTVGGDGTNGCFDNDGDFETQETYSTTERDECNYTIYPLLNSAIDPWVYYDGTITVTP